MWNGSLVNCSISSAHSVWCASAIYLYIVQSVGYKCNLSFKHGVSGATAFYLLNMYLSLYSAQCRVHGAWCTQMWFLSKPLVADVQALRRRPVTSHLVSPLEGPNRDKVSTHTCEPWACTFFPPFPRLTRGTPLIPASSREAPSSFGPNRSIFPSRMRPQVPEVSPATQNHELPGLRALLPWAPAAPRSLPTSI